MRPRLIRLNWSHFAVLSVGVALVMFFLVSLWEPRLGDMYAVEIGLPAMGRRLGFTYGPIRFQGQRLTPYGILSLDRDSVLARAGLRVHDRVWTGNAHDQGDHWAFYEALRAVDRGEAASIEVISLDEWAAKGSLMSHRIEIPARR